MDSKLKPENELVSTHKTRSYILECKLSLSMRRGWRGQVPYYLLGLEFSVTHLLLFRKDEEDPSYLIMYFRAPSVHLSVITSRPARIIPHVLVKRDPRTLVIRRNVTGSNIGKSLMHWLYKESALVSQRRSWRSIIGISFIYACIFGRVRLHRFTETCVNPFSLFHWV